MTVGAADLSADTFGTLSLLSGSGNINFDLGAGTLKLINNKNFSATTTSGNMISASNGTVETQGIGNLTLISGGNINLTNAVTLDASGTGNVALNSAADIVFTGGAGITTQGGNITLDSDTVLGGGAIVIGDGTTLSTITSNGGNITLGGGANAGTTAAIGDATYITGITLNNASPQAGGGNISLLGNSYSTNAGQAYGIAIYNGAKVQTIGSGTVAMAGISNASGVAGNDIGVTIVGNNTKLSVVNGNLTITGGMGSGNSDAGVSFTNNAVVETDGQGNISITGNSREPNGVGGGAGVVIDDSLVKSTASTGDHTKGTITISGAGTPNNDGSSYGVAVASGGDPTSITSVDGDIIINGNGGAAGGVERGIQIYQGAYVQATGIANITLNGVGGGNGGDSDNSGIVLYGNNGAGSSYISATSGNITLNGTGGSGSGGGNIGVYLGNGTSVTTTTGAINITGIDGTGGSGNYGIYTDNVAGNLLGGNSTSGNITLTANDLSIVTADFTAKTTGTVIIAPYSQNGTTGVAGGTGTLQLTSGILGDVSAGSLVIGSANDTGLMTINAYNGWTVPVSFITKSTGSITVAGNQVASGSGSLSFTGPTTLDANLTTANQNIALNGAVTLGTDSTINSGTATTSFGSTISDGAHNLTLTGDHLTLGGNVSGTGTLTIQPYSAGTIMHLNDGTSSGLYLTGAEQAYFQSGFSNITFGNTSDTGAMTVGASTWTSPLTLLNGSGNITLAGMQTMGANTFLANTVSGNLTLNNGAGVTSSAAGNAIVVAAGGNFVNNSGSATPFTASTGRFIGYSNKKTTDTNPVTNQQEIGGYNYGSLAPGSIVPATYSGTQNSWVYDVASGTITLTALPQSVIYGTRTEPPIPQRHDL